LGVVDFHLRFRMAKSFFSKGSQSQSHVSFPSGPMLAVDDLGVDEIERPRVVGGGQIRAGADANLASAVFDELLDRFSPRRFKVGGLLASRPPRHDQSV